MNVELVVKDGRFTVWDGQQPAVPVSCTSSGVDELPGFDYTINGLIIGNIYALLAVGLALIFGVSRLINFAHGSVYIVGAYVGCLAVTYLRHAAAGHLRDRGRGRRAARPRHRALRPAAAAGLRAHRAAAGDDRHQLRARPAGAAHLLARPARRAEPLPTRRFQIGGGTIGALDLVIAGIGLISAGAALLLPALHAGSAGRCARRPRTATPRSRWAST